MKNSHKTIALYGALRSGTTMLRLMLDNHPEISCPGETDFIFDHLKNVGNTYSYDIEALEGDRIYRNHREKFASRAIPTLSPDSLIERISTDASVGILVLHRNIGRTLAVFPSIRILHLVRDPRDVARSSIGMGWAGNVYYGIDHWIDTEREWNKYKPQLAEKQVLQVSYESLVARPEDTLRDICEFAGVPYHQAMMEYHVGSTYEKPDPKFIEQWRSKLSPFEVSLIEGKVGALMETSGYARSGHPLIVPSTLRRMQLKMENKRAIWAERIRHFGLYDPIIVSVCSKLGLKRAARRSRQRMDETKIRFLK